MFRCKCGQFIPAKETLLRRNTAHGHVHMPVTRFYNGPRCIEVCPACGAELLPQLAVVLDYALAADAIQVDHAGRERVAYTAPVVETVAVAA